MKKMFDRVGKRTAIVFCILLALLLTTVGTLQADNGRYATAVLDTEGLLGYWRFDGDSGAIGSTCTDSTGNNNGIYRDGKDSNLDPRGYTSFNFGEGAPIGEVGNVAVDFENFLSGIDVGTVPGFMSSFDGGYPGTTGATMEFWMKGDVDSYCKLMGMQKSNYGLRSQFAINLNANQDKYEAGQIGLFVALTDVNGNQGGGSYGTRVAGGAGVTDGDWHYVAITCGLQWGYETTSMGSQRLNIYVGTPGSTETIHYTYPDNEPTGRFWGTADDLAYSLYLGGMYNPAVDNSYLHYDGMMDEVALYSEALTKEQIDAHFEASITPIPGDADFNFIVDDADAAILADHWLQSDGVTWEDGDFNGDGWVNELDASILAANWQSGTSASVPEPCSMALLAGMFAAMLMVRRKR